MNNLYIDEALDGKGRGVYADKKISKGSIIEVCPVIIIPNDQIKKSLECYVYYWDKKSCAIALGYGSLYNHSYDAAALYRYRVVAKELVIVARKDIYAEDEITINYNYIVSDKTPVWFEVK